MIHETDLPCPTCGSELVETEIAAADLAVAAPDGAVEVAKCPECSSHYVPESTLQRLFESNT